MVHSKHRLSMRITIFLAALSLHSVVARAEGPAASSVDAMAVPAEEKPFMATLAGIDARHGVTFLRDDAKRELPLADLAFWGSPAEPKANRTVILLAGEGRIVAEILRADEETLTVRSELLGQMELPLEQVAGVVMRWPSPTAAADAWIARIRRNDARSDVILLANGDEASGMLAGRNEQGWLLRTEWGPLALPNQNVAAVLPNPWLARSISADDVKALVGLDDGSLLPVAAIATTDGSWTIKLPGHENRLEVGASLCYLASRNGRVIYLSDMAPAESEFTPYLWLAWPAVEADANIEGSPLRVGGRRYLKGLGMHSAARVRYGLDERFTLFQATVALDDSAEGRGAAIVRILVDGEQRETFEVAGDDRPANVTVDLRGANALEVVVDFGPRADVMDRVDWLDARLVRP